MVTGNVTVHGRGCVRKENGMKYNQSKTYPECPIFIRGHYLQELWLVIPVCFALIFFKQGIVTDIFIIICWLYSRHKATVKGWKYACDNNLTTQFLRGKHIVIPKFKRNMKEEEHKEFIDNEKTRIEHYHDVRKKVVDILRDINEERFMLYLVQREYKNMNLSELDAKKYIESHTRIIRGLYSQIKNIADDAEYKTFKQNTLPEYFDFGDFGFMGYGIYQNEWWYNKDSVLNDYAFLYMITVPYIDYLKDDWSKTLFEDLNYITMVKKKTLATHHLMKKGKSKPVYYYNGIERFTENYNKNGINGSSCYIKEMKKAIVEYYINEKNDLMFKDINGKRCLLKTIIHGMNNK